VELGLSNAAMFSANGEVLQPAEVLYKKPILVERGSFRPVTHVNMDMLQSAHEKFSAEPDVEASEIVQLAEITMTNLLSDKDEVDYHDFLARIDLLAAKGLNVMISDYSEYYRLAGYLSRFSRHKIVLTMGASSLRELFNEKYYTQLQGGILESFGRMFKNELRLFIYPYLEPETGDMMAVQNLEVAPNLRKLYEYLVERGCIEQLSNFNTDYLSVFSRDVLEKIREGDASWETMVSPKIAEIIKSRHFFGYKD